MDHEPPDRSRPDRDDPLHQAGREGVDHWVAVVKPGRVMFELAGVPEQTARDAMRLAMHKLPIKTRFVVRQEEA
jgi:large subunit ribosomal protein L16